MEGDPATLIIAFKASVQVLFLTVTIMSSSPVVRGIRLGIPSEMYMQARRIAAIVGAWKGDISSQL